MRDDHEHVTDDMNAGIEGRSEGGILFSKEAMSVFVVLCHELDESERSHGATIGLHPRKIHRTLLIFVVGAILADRFAVTVQFGNELEVKFLQLLRS